MMSYVGKLKYVQEWTSWLENSYGLRGCPHAVLAYQKNPNIRYYEVKVRDLFSDMEEHNPGFGEALYNTAIMEDLKYIRNWLNGVKTSKGLTDFAVWIEALFAEYEADADMHKLLPEKISAIFNAVQQVITDRLRGHPIYVIGYVKGNLLIASKSDIPQSLAESLLGG